jgi:hypothetical protein
MLTVPSCPKSNKSHASIQTNEDDDDDSVGGDDNDDDDNKILVHHFQGYAVA